MAGNDAIHANPPYAVEGQYVTQHITTRGSDFLWMVFAVMLFSDLVIMVWHFFVPRGQRLFHQLAVIILTTASIAYFSMASDLGYAGIATEFHAGQKQFSAGTLRQIWYARYIDWTITTPALLLELVLASGLPLSDIITLTFFDIVMIITGLIGALVKSSYKWGYWTFGMFALFYIWWVLIGPARTSAGVIGVEYKKSFTTSAAILSFLWLLYPVAWGLADGGNVITPDSEMIFYGVLDLLAKPVFCFIHLFSLSKLDLTALQLSSGKFSTGVVGAAAYDAEKHTRHHNTTASGNTPATAPAASGTGKKTGLFGRKGKYNNDQNITIHDNTPAIGRPSEATVVSQ